MNINELSFDTEQMILSLRSLVEIESPSFDAAAINKVIDLAIYDLASLGATIERVPGRFGYGDIVRAKIDNNPNNQSNNKTGVLVCCHADTVHPIGSLQTMPYRREGNKLFGAGVLSAKAGILICLEALRQVLHSDYQQQLPITVLIIPDKETGCASSRDFIEASVLQSKAVLVPEPAALDGGLILGRHAVSRYDLDVKVDTVAASSDTANSPIVEMARHLIEIENMSTDNCSFKVGSIQSGQWANYAEKCTAQVISVAKSVEAEKESSKKMLALNSPNPDSGLHVNRGVSLPLWQSDVACEELLNVAHAIGAELGLSLNASVAGNGSLGNISGAMGVPTLDGLGARGLRVYGKRAEFLEIDSLAERGKLFAGVLAKLS